MADQQSQAIGRAMRAMRKARGLSQTQVAEALGTRQATISRWESGTVTPDAVEVANYAHVHGESPVTLYTQEVEAAVPRTIKNKARRLEREINERHFKGGKKGG